MASECPICGAMTLVEQHGDFEFMPPGNIPGGKIVVCGASWQECKTCEQQIILPPLRQALDNESRKRRGLLTPREIKEVRERAGLSQSDMAELLGVGDRTYTRWETGRSIQNKSNDNLIRLVAKNAGLFAQLDAERQPGRHRTVADYVARLQTLKGGNSLGMAAHGAELDPTVSEILRKKLCEIRDAKRRSGLS